MLLVHIQSAEELCSKRAKAPKYAFEYCVCWSIVENFLLNYKYHIYIDKLLSKILRICLRNQIVDQFDKVTTQLLFFKLPCTPTVSNIRKQETMFRDTHYDTHYDLFGEQISTLFQSSRLLPNTHVKRDF